MATISDIAKKANVAISTVSYVINNTKNVKPETRDRILKIIEEMDYEPRVVARSLKTKKSLTIGIIVPDIANMFFIGIIRGIEDVANKFGYSVILCNTDEDTEKEKKYLNTLISKDIDGLIFVGTGKNQNILEDRLNISIVVVDRKLGEGFNSITVDNIRGGFLATDYLIRKNGTEVLLLTGPLSINTYFDRMKGYMEALQLNGQVYNELLVHQTSVSHEGGYKAIEDILGKGVKQFKSVFASNDLIALGAIKALTKRGIKVPEDVAIVGYDDIPAASIHTPSLTTVMQPQYVMGEKAMELLLEQIKGRLMKARQVVLKPDLIIRESA